jgi:dTDP-4-dehydrorhamnose 3,5-epimerase
MIFTACKLKDAFLIDLARKDDERGFFARSYCRNEFAAHGLQPDYVQSNLSFNARRGTLRGMHYQAKPDEEVKLVRCIRGTIYDVIIDLRKDSPTYKQWLGVELDADARRMLYAPAGVAHGYLTLADDTEVQYQVSAFYSPESERAVRWNDPAFNIKWPIQPVVISSKDRRHPDFVP